MSVEVCLIFWFFTLISGVGFGYWQANNLLINNAKYITRTECRGNLYWIVEDGDKVKLKHINNCFSDSSGDYDYSGGL